jgi:hypothetical protein
MKSNNNGTLTREASNIEITLVLSETSLSNRSRTSGDSDNLQQKYKIPKSKHITLESTFSNQSSQSFTNCRGFSHKLQQKFKKYPHPNKHIWLLRRPVNQINEECKKNARKYLSQKKNMYKHDEHDKHY